MNKIALGALLLAACGFANPAIAAGNAVATTMQVSFVIQEACTVRVTDGSHAAPDVSCVHQAPVQVSAATGATQAAPSQTVAGTDGWQIYF